MRTWEDYKAYAKSVDPQAKIDIEEAESLASIVTAMIQQRNAMGLSQRELAEKCGMPQSSVARIESHKMTPKLDTLIKILSQLDLQIKVVPYGVAEG